MKENNYIAPVWYFAVSAVATVVSIIIAIRSWRLSEKIVSWCEPMMETYNKLAQKLVDEDE